MVGTGAGLGDRELVLSGGRVSVLQGNKEFCGWVVVMAAKQCEFP